VDVLVEEVQQLRVEVGGILAFHVPQRITTAAPVSTGS
jgi:hypothetical protein